MGLNTKFLTVLLFVNFFAFAQIKGDEWNLIANSRENYFGVAMANGKIGIVTDDTPLKTKEIILNGVYDANPKNGISKVVRGIEFLNLHLSIDDQMIDGTNIDHWSQQVSMKEGTSTTSFQFKDLAQIKYTILANRVLPYSAMAIVEIVPMQDIEISAFNYMNVPEEMKITKSEFRVMKKKNYGIPLFKTTAQTNTGKWTVSASTTFLFDGPAEFVTQKGPEVGFSKKILKGKTSERKIALQVVFKETATGFSIELTDEEGISSIFEVGCDKQPAQKPDAVNDNIKNQLSKLGNTIYEAADVQIEINAPWFFQASQLSEWRRLAIERLDEVRAAAYVRELKHEAKPATFTTTQLSYLGNVTNKLSEEFYHEHGVEDVLPGFEVKAEEGVPLMYCKHCIKYSMGWCPKEGYKATFKEPLYLRNNDQVYQLTFDCKACEMRISKA